MRIAGFGGTMNDAQIKAYYEPFEKISGIKVRAFPGSNPTKVKAMVETGNVEWDMAQLSRGSIMNLQKSGDYFEKIDYDIIDPDVDPAYRFEYGLEMLVWAQVLAYRSDQTKGAVPKGWADFWDTKKFPGDRAMIGTSAGSWPELEFALMAAGVPADKLYPLDIDKGFASYDKIKKSIVKWWDTGAIPIQLLTDREVTMTTRVERPHGGASGGGRAGGDQLEPGPLEARRLGHSQGRQEQGERHEVRGLLDHGDPAGAHRVRHPLRLGQQRVERVHPARAAGGAAERARHQVAARQLQLRLVDRQSRHRGQPLQQMAAELSAMNGSGRGASVLLTDLEKRFDRTNAVDGVSLDIRSGEFLTLLGPSGSGKTTTLMMIAGFETPTAGDIAIDAKSVVAMPPYRRNIGMVFQNYALFPHLTVADNIGFPLKQRGVPKAERAKLVAEALELVHLPGYGARYPRQLSGGQQQRVAVARAIVFKPRLLLMDEPLGALDKQLRENLQLEMRRLHADLGITFIYVTHDQEEALTMSDRIAVMNDGKVAQVGRPEDLYDRPTSRFVAGFIGEFELPARRRARHRGRRRRGRVRGRDHPRDVARQARRRREGDADDAAGAPALRRRRLEPGDRRRIA